MTLAKCQHGRFIMSLLKDMLTEILHKENVSIDFGSSEE